MRTLFTALRTIGRAAFGKYAPWRASQLGLATWPGQTISREAGWFNGRLDHLPGPRPNSFSGFSIQLLSLPLPRFYPNLLLLSMCVLRMPSCQRPPSSQAGSQRGGKPPPPAASPPHFRDQPAKGWLLSAAHRPGTRLCHTFSFWLEKEQANFGGSGEIENKWYKVLQLRNREHEINTVL